jgi:ADP-ribose pyrophosphatase
MTEKDPLFEKKKNREVLFKGKYLDLERMDVVLPDGRTGIREVVRVKDAVAILPLDDKGIVHMVRQHRPAINRTIIEIPAGLIDDGESMEQAAARECEEETGYLPEKLEKLLTYSHAEGYSTGFITLFLGTNLRHTEKYHLDDSEHLEQVALPFKELLELVRKNEIIDSKTILCTLLSEKLI